MEGNVFDKLSQIAEPEDTPPLFAIGYEQDQRILQHRSWLQSIRKQRPSASQKLNIGVYIRFFNQTKHENYLDYHMKEFEDTIAACPNWTLHDFYIDEGQTAPNMENAEDLCRLLDDCMAGKIDVIVTQKTSNISGKLSELTFCCRLLAALEHPVGIYFISEDIYTLASYYQSDLRDTWMFPTADWQILPDTEEEKRAKLHD